MRIIPVLDLKDGVVVRARAGDRASYRAIETPLSASAEPSAVAAGLRGLHPFRTYYCADIDAIEGRAPNHAAIRALRTMPDAPDIWLDAGVCREESLAAALSMPHVHPVIGTESQADAALLSRFAGHPRLILSLDFFGDGYRGPREILDTESLWPRTVIVMTLARVGTGAGPDMERLAEIKRRAGDRDVIAAGGVRDAGDAEMLVGLGIAGALVATALHEGRFTPSQLAELER